MKNKINKNNSKSNHKIYYILVSLLLVISCATKPIAHSSNAEFKLVKAFEQTQSIHKLEVVESLSELFDDENISQIIKLVRENNFSIKAAKENIKAADFGIEISKASLLPNLNFSGNKSSTNREIRQQRTTSNSYRVSLDSSWELDIWGRNKNQLQSSEISKQIQQQKLESLEQSLVSQAIQVYFQTISAKKTLRINQSQQRSIRQLEKVIRGQVSLGLSGTADLNNAKVSSLNAKTRVQQAKLNYNKSVRTLNILLGLYPSEKLPQGFKKVKRYPKINKIILAEIPSEVLLKRPDIKQSYLSVMQLDKVALIAYKDMFPKFNLTASLGRTTDKLRNLTNGSLNVWTLAFGVVAPIFDAGRRKARVGQAKSQSNSAYNNYQQVVLNALLEVENALNNNSSLKKQLRLAKSSLYNSKAVERQAKTNYSNGVSSIFELLNAKSARYNAEQFLENIKLQQYQSRVSLALALGKAY